MESEYVRRSVGQALTLGLAEVATVRPADPVEYLALWLLQHKRNLNEKDRVDRLLYTWHGNKNVFFSCFFDCWKVVNALEEIRLENAPKTEEKEEEETEEQAEDKQETETVEEESRDAEQPLSSTSDVTETNVTPPLSGSAQGRPNSKLSSIMEAEEQEKPT